MTKLSIHQIQNVQDIQGLWKSLTIEQRWQWTQDLKSWFCGSTIDTILISSSQKEIPSG